jgi:ribosome biogenesis GTPase
MNLRELGISTKQLKSWKGSGGVLARIVNLSIGRYLALSEDGYMAGPLPRARTAGWIAVGDWAEIDSSGRILCLLPRKSALSRRTAGSTEAEQIIAANVDYAFLIQGLDGDFNPRRMERYLAMVQSGGVQPVIVMTKEDLASDLPEQIGEIRRSAAGAPVYSICAPEARGLDPIVSLLQPGVTAVFLGSSGAGKSTLLNVILGREAQETRAVREDDSRGRHTTTSRMMFRTPQGALVIDTPGMRELQLWNADEGVSLAFPEIEELSAGCKFRDCTHEREPGCAVLQAVADGTLDPRRHESYLKLRHEAAAQSARMRRMGRDSEATKAISRIVRDVVQVKRNLRSGL